MLRHGRRADTSVKMKSIIGELSSPGFVLSACCELAAVSTQDMSETLCKQAEQYYAFDGAASESPVAGSTAIDELRRVYEWAVLVTCRFCGRSWDNRQLERKPRLWIFSGILDADLAEPRLISVGLPSWTISSEEGKFSHRDSADKSLSTQRQSSYFSGAISSIACGAPAFIEYALVRLNGSRNKIDFNDLNKSHMPSDFAQLVHEAR